MVGKRGGRGVVVVRVLRLSLKGFVRFLMNKGAYAGKRGERRL